MKNIEKYRDEILNNECNFCNVFIGPVILKEYRIKCGDIDCERCRMIQTIWANEEYKEPECPELTAEELEKLPVDTLLEVWDNNDWKHLRYFAEYKNGRIYCWDNGVTSKTAKTAEANTCWRHARLAE